MGHIEDLVARGRIRRQTFTDEEIVQTWQRAREELGAAHAVADRYPSSAFELSYAAMFLAGTSLMQSDGYRAVSDGHHRTLVEYLEERLGVLDMGLVNELDEARKKRNWTIYASRRATRKEVQHCLAAAEQFLALIRQRIVESREIILE